MKPTKGKAPKSIKEKPQEWIKGYYRVKGTTYDFDGTLGGVIKSLLSQEKERVIKQLKKLRKDKYCFWGHDEGWYTAERRLCDECDAVDNAFKIIIKKLKSLK